MRFAWIVGVAASALVATGASADVVLVRGMDKAPETLDPQRAATFAETPILADLFEGLTTHDGLGRVVPGAAESWTVSADGLTYTFLLRSARWSDGSLVKASDFVASFRRLFSPQTEATEAGPLMPISGAAAVQRGDARPEALGVKAIDARTLEIRLEHPTPTFVARLALPVALPVNVESIRKFGADFGTTGKIVSNGAYRLATIDKKDGYILVKSPRFRASDTVAIDSVVYKPFESASACLDAYRAHAVQSCNDVQTEKLGDLKTEFGAALRVAPYAGTYYYAVNLGKKPFDDVRVRQALSLSIDREALAKSVWSGGMLPAAELVPPALFDTSPAAEKPLAERRAEAQKLLTEAGFSAAKPLKFVIRVGTGSAHEQTAQALIDQWKTLGIVATIETEGNTAHFTRLRDGGDFDIARTGWIADENDPIDLLTVLRGDNVRFNYPRYKNADFDKLLDQANGEMDPAKRAKLLAEAEALIDRDVPVIPVLEYATLSLVSPSLSGWNDNVGNWHPTRYMALAAAPDDDTKKAAGN